MQRARTFSDRSFGLTFAGFFTLLALLPLLKGHPPRPYFLPPALLFALLAWMRPQVLALPADLWHKLGILLGRIVAPVIMGVIYFSFVLPTGLLMKAFGKDPLALRRDQRKDSYWIPREKSPDAESMRLQF